MKKRWKIRKHDPIVVKELTSSLDISPVLAQLLVNRGHTDVRSAALFLRPTMEQMQDPYQFRDMERAVARIGEAIRRGEKITVYGDYDVDGLTATALLILALRELGANPSYYIPHRVKEGYGLNKAALSELSSSGTQLLITVDCASNARREVEYAQVLGMDVIVTDHHVILDDSLPQKLAAHINPRHPDCSYPFKELAGVGVAYKLAQALLEEKGKQTKKYLDLVALGTVADVVPLYGENRVFIQSGLEVFRRSPRLGLKELLAVAGLKKARINSRQLGFTIAPRLNATGRMRGAEHALELLLTDSTTRACFLARFLDQENRRRQRIENRIVKEAVNRVEGEIDLDRRRIIILADTNWHPGVVGIVSSRLVEKYHRPVILLTLQDTHGKGSARSIEHFHLFDALTECRDLLLNFGGHARAAGLTLHCQNLPHFTSRMEEIGQSRLTDEDMVPMIVIDFEIPLNLVTPELLEEIALLEPYGMGNERPLFATGGVEVVNQPRLVGNNHLKLWVRKEKRIFDAIGFGMADRLAEVSSDERWFDIAYRPELNEWQGRNTIQLNLREIRKQED